MNTKNNPENDKLPVNEENKTEELQPATTKNTSLAKNPQPPDSQADEPELASSVAATAEENEIDSVSDKVLPEEVQVIDEDEPANDMKAVDSVSDEVLPEEVQTADAEVPVSEIKDDDIVSEEVVSEEVQTADAEVPVNEIKEDDIVSEEVVSEEAQTADAKEPVEDNIAADAEEPVSIDYDLEDVHEEEEAEDEDAHDAEGDVPPDDAGVSLLPIEEIVQHLRNLLQSDNPKRKDVDEYKNQFYRSLRNETENQKQAFLTGGGEEIDFIVNEPELFAEGKELLQKIKDKRSVIAAQEEAEKEKNLARKLAIIDQIKLLTETQGQEDFNKSYQEFKSLQQEWNDIKQVPQAKVNELWKSYQHYVEIFYDLVRINNEFREYDFRKNLELKTELCEAAERLDEETDVISAFHQLQNLHQEWREIGPVSRKDREEIWNRFKEASANINKKYQLHFEDLRGKEDENLELKIALCEKLEAIDYSRITTVKEWNSKVKEVLDIQSQWRQIGYVPRKWNTKIYKRYRAACDLFFKAKNDFYKSLRGEMEENLRKKIELCERAEAMKDSHDWKKTTQEMIEIQKEWKSIGIVPHKYVDSIWKRFISACDYFFEQKKMHTSSQYEEESRNLEAKKEIVNKISKLDPSLETEEALSQLHELMDEWYAIGHVPFKLKDRVYREFYEATEAQFDRLNIDKADRKLESFKTNLSDLAKSGNARNQLLYEREKLMRQYERMKGELQTYENNIGFLSVSSKKGNHLVDNMNQKVEKIKSELQLIIKKVEVLDKELG